MFNLIILLFSSENVFHLAFFLCFRNMNKYSHLMRQIASVKSVRMYWRENLNTGHIKRQSKQKNKTEIQKQRG